MARIEITGQHCWASANGGLLGTDFGDRNCPNFQKSLGIFEVDQNLLAGETIYIDQLEHRQAIINQAKIKCASCKKRLPPDKAYCDIEITQ